MSINIDRNEIARQLVEIDRAQRDREHRADGRRRRAVQGLAAVGLLSAAAREAYRREVLGSLPSARFLLKGGDQLLEQDRKSARAAVLDAYRWQATMRPSLEAVNGSVASTSSHAASIALSAVGGERRAEENPWLSIASAGFSMISAYAAGRQVLDEIEEGHLDLFTTLNALTSIAAVPLTIPEAVRGMRGLFRR